MTLLQQEAALEVLLYLCGFGVFCILIVFALRKGRGQKIE